VAGRDEFAKSDDAAAVTQTSAQSAFGERERERERERGRNEMGKQLVWQLAELRQKEKMTHVETSEKAKKC
jgi:hypothetical protein